VLSDRAESADWQRQARLRGMHGDIDDEPGNVLVGPVSMPDGVDGGTVGQSDSGSSEDAGSARTRMLSHALNIRCVDAAASESMEWLAGIGGLLTSAARAAEVKSQPMPARHSMDSEAAASTQRMLSACDSDGTCNKESLDISLL
jgi:hypothetical protein